MKPSHLAYLCQVVSMKNAKHQQKNSNVVLTLKDVVPSVTNMAVYPK
jgi:hypothetical protein